MKSSSAPISITKGVACRLGAGVLLISIFSVTYGTFWDNKIVDGLLRRPIAQPQPKQHGIVKLDPRKVSLLQVSATQSECILPKSFATRFPKHARLSKESRRRLSLMVVTKSAPANFKTRSLAREGWLMAGRAESLCRCDLINDAICTEENSVCSFKARGRHLTWTHRFVVGCRNLTRKTESELCKERSLHNDLILYPHRESYNRLPWKTVWMLTFLQRHILSDFVLLVDDDCFVQVWRVAMYLARAPRQKLYSGHVDSQPGAVGRHFWSKWRITPEQYNASHFPRYAWGAGIFLSHDVVELAVEASRRWSRPWFSIEDAFLGVLLNSSGVSPQNVEQIYTAGLYKRLGCADSRSDEGQPLILAGDEGEIKFLIEARQENRTLCTLMSGTSQTLLRIAIISPVMTTLTCACALTLLLAIILWLVRR